MIEMQRSCEGRVLFAFTGCLYKCGKSKIADFDVHVAIEKQVPQFQVSVNDLIAVHVVASPYDLDKEEPCFGLGESASMA